MQIPHAPGAEASEAQRLNRELALVHDLALAINARLELRPILTTFAERLKELVPFDDASVILPSGSWQGEVKAAWPHPPRCGEVAVLDTGVNGRACSKCEVLLNGEARWQISTASGCPSLEATPFKSAVCLPLSFSGKRRGMLWLRSFEPEVYTDGDVRLLELVAAHLALALGNAEALAAMQELAKMRADFFALASHQLRTPLTVARGYAEILAGEWDRLPADERQLYLGRVSRSYGMLADLVDEMLDIARIEGGVAALRIEPVDLLDAVENCLESLSGRAGERLVDFPADSCWVEGDRFRVEQILFNLLDNAFKYSEGPGNVVVEWERLPHGGVRVDVSNPCPDLTPEEFATLFQPFCRLERHAHLPGTGLGLRACKALVELMGGAIGAQSVGGRIAIWFELPVATAPEGPGSV